jgi:hypothetical protein
MRLRRQVLLIAAGLMSVLAGPDESAVAASGRYEPGQYLTDERVEKIHDLILNTLPSGKPPISKAEARRITASAILSALAKKCDLPWDRQVYLPLMRHYRHTVGLNEEQMKLLGIVYGWQQGSVLQAIGQEPCTPQTRAEVLRSMSKQ